MLETEVRKNGAVPATIIVIDGCARIGISDELKEILYRRLEQGSGFAKLGMRDLPAAWAKKQSGGTTVSATMKLAYEAGIKVFATGGIGGVHRDWQDLPDISSDLKALAQIPVVLVSAGCKAILDIPATLEVMETLAIPLLGWRTDSFPQFYTRNSKHRIERVDSTREFARFYELHTRISGSGILVANPIPASQSIPSTKIEPAISKGIRAARDQGVRGRELTPFLLDFLAHDTKGVSVKANLALLKNNARLAAKLAVSICGNERGKQ
jgi:pseudouridine-5'-phosphate glycosidase